MTTTAPTLRVQRVEVRPTDRAGDPIADALARDAAALGITARARTARVYLIETDLADDAFERTAAALLADPVLETITLGASPAPGDACVIEVHPLPGVMDPAAASVADAIATLTDHRPRVSTGWRYELEGVSADDAKRLAERLLANPVVQAVHTDAFHPDALPEGHETEFRVTRVGIRDLDDAGLEKLSRDGHLFLSLDEMRAIRDEYRTLGREPTDIELETLAQTWSEHCVHKTLKSTITYRSDDPDDPVKRAGRPGHTIHADGSVTIKNLLKSTVAAATHELIADGIDWTLSVFVDNAGIIAFDDDHAVCVKVETHNHPSAIEPYGGAATGIGGCIRDVIGTGLAAKPIASTDVFCVAPPDAFTTGDASASSLSPAGERAGVRGAQVPPSPLGGEGRGEGSSDSTLSPSGRGQGEGSSAPLPAGCLHPKRILNQVVAGVRDYGNRMGIPTVNGAVWFDDRYVGNPLVYCGCVGVMPRGDGDSLISGDAKPGDRIIALGGRTGRDGIHGATFSSAELTDTHADEFAHAVQIGNAIEEKRVLDAILRARDAEGGPLFSAITDCGAGGFSSAVGEMGETIGANVHLDRAPLKYAGLTYTEIWISEAQERMVLSVPEENVAALQRICDEEHVELADLGTFGTDGAELILNYHGTEVGRLPMAFLHDGIPTPTREATWSAGPRGPKPAAQIPPSPLGGEDRGEGSSSPSPPSIRDALLTLLAHPNIASKHWIIQQYDHEVQGNTIVRPLVGPRGVGPSDAAVIEPVPGTGRGLAIACGLATGLEDDPYQMALAAVDECVRNLVCVGADPERIAILDNFCWPSCKKPENLASLVRAAEGCYDGAMAYRTPFVSGKDSLNNQFTTDDGRTIEIPPTLLISGIGIVDDIAKCVTSDLKRPGNPLFVIEAWKPEPLMSARLGGSHYARAFGMPVGADERAPEVQPEDGPRQARAIAEAIRLGLVASCHDSSDGGPLVAISEMLIAGHRDDHPIGVEWADIAPPARLWSERPSCYIVEVHREHENDFIALMSERGGGWTRVGQVTNSGRLECAAGNDQVSLSVDELTRAWRGTLDW
ncbi:MAG: phosphoribosylformylglycinamidine synthase subunit PurS [Phycisphaerales bacterium]